MNREVKFKDADSQIFTVKVEIKDGRLSMSGDYGSGCGQCLDSIKPKNAEQKRLVEIWNMYHLNDMKAGTVKQEEFLQRCEKDNHIKIEYGEAIRLLEQVELLTVPHPDKPGKFYTYGDEWLKRELPEGLETELHEVCNRILLLEQEAKTGKLIKDLTDDELEERGYGNEEIALAKHLELTTDELEEIEQRQPSNFEYGGMTYFVGTEEEAEQTAMDYLTNDPYLWQEAAKAGHTELGLQEWAEEVVSVDGVGHILNSHDGTEDSEEVNGMWYTIIRR